MLIFSIPEALAYKLSSRVQLNANPVLCHQALRGIDQRALTGEHSVLICLLYYLYSTRVLCTICCKTTDEAVDDYYIFVLSVYVQE